MNLEPLKKSLVFNNLFRIFKFGTVGVSGVGVNAGTLYFFTDTCKLDYRISSLLAIELSIVNNFIWNYLWTWSDKKGSGMNSFFRYFIKFQISTTSVAIINYGVLVGCTEWFKIPYMYSNIAGIIIGSIVNFLTGHFWVFKEKRIKNELNPAN